MTFELTFKALKPDKFAFYLLQIESLDRLRLVLFTFYFLDEKLFLPLYLNL